LWLPLQQLKTHWKIVHQVFPSKRMEGGTFPGAPTTPTYLETELTSCGRLWNSLHQNSMLATQKSISGSWPGRVTYQPLHKAQEVVSKQKQIRRSQWLRAASTSLAAITSTSQQVVREGGPSRWRWSLHNHPRGPPWKLTRRLEHRPFRHPALIIAAADGILIFKACRVAIMVAGPSWHLGPPRFASMKRK
jgi:hypothetical protein